MDRIYINSDSDIYKFKEFANEKGFMYKEYNHSYINFNINFIYKGKAVKGECSINIDGDFKKYPFIDTMCFLNEEKNKLSNIPSYLGWFLHSTEGECEKCGCEGLVIYNSREINKNNKIKPDFCDSCAQGLCHLHRYKIDNSWSKWFNDRYKK